MNNKDEQFKPLLEKLLQNWQNDCELDNEEIYRLLYQHLRQLSKDTKSRLTAKPEHQDFNQIHSTTTIVHELYYKIKKGKDSLMVSEKALIKQVSDMARHVIFDLAQRINSRKNQEKRAFESGLERFEDQSHVATSDAHQVKLIMLNKALDKLQTLEPLWVEAFNYKHFGNLTEKQIAELMDCSRYKARSYIENAKSWLQKYL